MSTIVKDPDADLDYVFNWSNWLGGDTISTSSWTVSPGISVQSDSHSTTTTTVWLTGGTGGQRYTVTNSVTTAGGRKNDKSMLVRVVEK